MKTNLRKLIAIASGAALSLSLLVAFTADAADQNVQFEFSPVQIDTLEGETFEFTLQLDNPSAQSIVSARGWLEYDPAKVEGVEIVRGADMNLTAPNESQFLTGSGLIALGFAHAGGTDKTEIEVVTVKMTAKEHGKLDLKFYDYPNHTTAKVVEGGIPVNVLVNPAATVLPISISLEEDAGNGGGYRNTTTSTPSTTQAESDQLTQDITDSADESEAEVLAAEPPKVAGGGAEDDEEIAAAENEEVEIVASAPTDFTVEAAKVKEGMWKITAQLDSPQADEKFKFMTSEGVLDQTQVQTDEDGEAYVLFSSPAQNGEYKVTALWVGHAMKDAPVTVDDQSVLVENDSDLLATGDEVVAVALRTTTDEMDVKAASDSRPPELVKTGAGHIVIFALPLAVAGLIVFSRRRAKTSTLKI